MQQPFDAFSVFPGRNVYSHPDAEIAVRMSEERSPLTAITLHLGRGRASAVSLRIFVRRDNFGKPGRIIARSEWVSINQLQWYRFPISPVCRLPSVWWLSWVPAIPHPVLQPVTFAEHEGIRYPVRDTFEFEYISPLDGFSPTSIYFTKLSRDWRGPFRGGIKCCLD